MPTLPHLPAIEPIIGARAGEDRLTDRDEMLIHASLRPVEDQALNHLMWKGAWLPRRKPKPKPVPLTELEAMPIPVGRFKIGQRIFEPEGG